MNGFQGHILASVLEIKVSNESPSIHKPVPQTQKICHCPKCFAKLFVQPKLAPTQCFLCCLLWFHIQAARDTGHSSNFHYLDRQGASLASLCYCSV